MVNDITLGGNRMGIELMAGCAAIISGISSISLSRHIYNIKINGNDSTLDAIGGKYLCLNSIAATIWLIYHINKNNTMAIILSIIFILNLAFVVFIKYGI